MDNMKFLVIGELIVILFIIVIYRVYKYFEKKSIDKILDFMNKNKNIDTNNKLNEFIDIKKGSDK